jgi:hypothetical protein
LSLGEWIVVRDLEEEILRRWIEELDDANMADLGRFSVNSAQLHLLTKGGYITHLKADKRAIHGC